MVIYSSPRLCLIGESIPLAIDEIRCQIYPRRTKNSWSERHGHIYIISVLSNKQIWEPISRYSFTTVYHVYSILLIICMTKKRVQLIRTKQRHHRYNDVTMSAMASEITSLTIVYSTVYSGAEKRKYQSSVLLAFVRGIHRSQSASNAEDVSIWWRHHDGCSGQSCVFIQYTLQVTVKCIDTRKYSFYQNI